MKIPGEPSGPFALPCSYSREQLEENGWDSETKRFKRPKGGAWGSRLNDKRWQDQGPSPRYTHHFYD